MSKEKWVAIEDTINLIDDHIEIRNCCAEYVCKKLNEKNQRISELEEQLKKSLESNNNFLKQIMELQSQLIIERLKGENK